jgi:hypothetical protein
MKRQLGISQRVWIARNILTALAILGCALGLSKGTSAADLAEQAHSLRKVPADASFYSATLRLKEQWHIFLESKAYAKLMEIPFVQVAKMQIGYQWQQSEEPHVAKFREYVQSPAGQDAVGVLKEMFSDECFMYGGGEIAEMVKLFMDFNSLQRTGSFEVTVKGKGAEEATINQALEILDKHADSFKIPTMVFGFRIKDQARAKRELNEVHSLLRNLLDQEAPELAAHLQRDQIAGHEFLTMRLEASMLPWDKVREEAKNLDDEQFEKLKKFVNKHKLAIALGVTDEFVLLSIGETTDHLEKLGQGPVLADQAPIKRLQKHANQRIVAIQYMSKALAASVGSTSRSFDDMARMADAGLRMANISDEHRKEIAEDIRGLSLNLARYMPEQGDVAGVGFLTPRGYEGFQYTDTKQRMMDSSKPLTILNHVGGNPMVLIASRSKQNIEDYEQAVAWLKKTAGHIEKIAEEKSKPEDWAKYQKFRKRALGLLERLDKANREHLYPALADGQGAFILDISAKSKQWFNTIPESPKPLPMLELAFAAGVSDAERLRQAVKTYIEVAQEAYDMVKEINSRDMPELKLPKAHETEIADGGKLYSYPLPKKWGIDPQVAVNAGLTDKLVAVSTMPQTSQRLLRETKPNLDTSLPLDEPAALVVHIEFAKFFDALRPWIDYGVDVATGKLKLHPEEGPEAEKDRQAEQSPMLMQMGFVVPQVQQLLDVVSAVRSATAITYEEDGAWVTHSETHIQDLK